MLQLLQLLVQFWQHVQQHVPGQLQWLPDGLSLLALYEQHLFESLAPFETFQPAVTVIHPPLSRELLLCQLHIWSRFVSIMPLTGQLSTDALGLSLLVLF